jgi:hypothetical protein
VAFFIKGISLQESNLKGCGEKVSPRRQGDRSELASDARGAEPLWKFAIVNFGSRAKPGVLPDAVSIYDL